MVVEKPKVVAPPAAKFDKIKDPAQKKLALSKNLAAFSAPPP